MFGGGDEITDAVGHRQSFLLLYTQKRAVFRGISCHLGTRGMGEPGIPRNFLVSWVSEQIYPNKCPTTE